jgi:hypothetical protein
MAATWTAKLESVQEVDGRAIIDATITKTDAPNPVRTFPYHVEYNDAALMTLAQAQTDILNYARTLASKGTAIDLLKTKVGQTFTLPVG